MFRREPNILVFATLMFLRLALPAFGADAALQWMPTVAPELSGYYIHYNTGSSGPPYTGSGAWEGHSPVAVDAQDVCGGEVCYFTLTGLSDTEVYYFAVTAYDSEGNESAFSREACLNCASGGTSPVIEDLIPGNCEPGSLITIVGRGFGESQGDSVVYVGPKAFGPGNRRVRLWTDTMIEIRLPKYKSKWFKGNDSRTLRVWAAVDRGSYVEDSTDRTITVIIPGTSN